MKVKLTKTTLVSFAAFLMIIPVIAFAEEPPIDPSMPGRVEGTGTYFELTDSEYLNTSLQSSEEITVFLESVPKTISLHIEASSPDSTTLTIGGLKSNKTYYKFEDSYKNKVEFTTDDNGNYAFTQDLTQTHHIWFQPEDNGTVFLPEDCSTYGTWDELTSTCTLTQDLTENVEITASNITFDCNDHSVTGTGTGYGIYLNYRGGVIIKNCTVGNFSTGIRLAHSSNNTVAENNTSNNYRGIVLDDWSSNNNINENNVSNSSGGITLSDGSSFNNIAKNIVLNNNIGIGSSYDSSNNNITENHISNNEIIGLLLFDSPNNNIVGNAVFNNYQKGISLTSSPNNYFRSNSMVNNTFNFGVSGEELPSFIQDINTSNTVNGKPIYYLINEENKTVDSSWDIGYLGVVNSENVTVKDITIEKNVQGVLLAYTNGSRIENIKTSGNMIGIHLFSSSNNDIAENTISGNITAGIRLQAPWGQPQLATNNNITKNDISNNGEKGIFLIQSSNNSVIENNISDNGHGIFARGHGIFISRSSDNLIYHNNFIDNYHQAFVEYGTGNLFDGGYLEGGNYWSNYDTPQEGCNDSNNDGICDAPYTFLGGQDKYPFMVKDGWVGPVCGNNICESGLGETFENCYLDCMEEGIEKYFPYYRFSTGEQYFPASFYFDVNANTGDNEDHYTSEFWDKNYVYIHSVEDETYLTIQYWLYSAYNEHQHYTDHENDWDATIFLVFNKEDFAQPIEVHYARHYYIINYSWGEIERVNDTHPVVYVAEGSHGGYPTTEMRSRDEFESGGKELNLNNFNWYFTTMEKGCFREELLPVEGVAEDRVFCNLQPKLIKGEPQSYPQEWVGGYEGYWPRDFFGDAFWPRFRHFDSPWMRIEWEQTRPPGWDDWLEYILGTSADLHIYDPLGRHIGINYETGEPEIQIPDAEYLIEPDGQYIFIPNPIEGDYKIEIIGTKEESYNLATVRSKDEEIVYWKENKDVPISEGEIHTFIQTQISWAIPKYLKESGINKLEESKTGDKKIDKEIDKIIKYIENSLKDREELLWLDDWHLKPEIRNIKVFTEQREAVKRMLNDIESKRGFWKIELPEEVKEAFREVVNNLTESDKLLAKTIIEDAKVTDVKNPKFEKLVKHLISKAVEEYERGLEELGQLSSESHLFEKYPQEKAITRFSKAWLFGQLAIKAAEGDFWKQSSLIGIRFTAGIGLFSLDEIFKEGNPISQKNVFLIKTLAFLMVMLTYSLILFGILKLFTFLIKKSLKDINKKALFTSVVLGMASMYFYNYLLLSRVLPYQTIGGPLTFGVCIIPASLILIFSFILFKKFPEAWKDIKIRLFLLFLLLISFIYGIAPAVSIMSTPPPLIGYLDLLKETFHLILILFLLPFTAWGLKFVLVALVYSGIITIPTAFIITKGIKNKYWRTGFIAISIILMLLVSGFPLGLTFWE